MNVLRRRAARLDIDDIAEHIGRDSLEAAERFLDAVNETFQLLMQFPGAGTAVQTRRANGRCPTRWNSTPPVLCRLLRSERRD